jgi:hypothetical protein
MRVRVRLSWQAQRGRKFSATLARVTERFARGNSVSPALLPLPTQLDGPDVVDPFSVEPGVLLFGGRFCVVEPAQFSTDTWSLVVSDVERVLGEAPHHRLHVQHIMTGGDVAAKIRLAAAVDSATQSHVYHWMSQPSGTLLLTQSARSLNLQAPLSPGDSILVASALTDLLARLHEAGVVGVGIQQDQIQLSRDKVTLTGFQHILHTGSASNDIQSLISVLDPFVDESVKDALRPIPRTAKQLLDRVRALNRQPVETLLAELLPSRAPFIGRETTLRSMLKHFEAARRGEAQIVGVVGAEGMGKSRLLEQLQDELARYAPCRTALASFGVAADARVPGFVGALDTLALASLLGSPKDRTVLAHRIRDAAGPLTSLIASLSTGLSQLLGAETRPPELHLDEQFVRHASTIANVIRSVGTSERPLIVLLDDAHEITPADQTILRYLLDETVSHHTMVVACSLSPIPHTLDAVIPTLYALTAFTVSDIERLTSATLPGHVESRRDLAQTLWKHSRGIPMTVWATIQAWTNEGYLVYRPDSRSWFLDGSPSTTTGVVDLFRHHYRQLSLDARYLGLLASIQPSPVTRQWFAEVTAWAADRVGRATYSLVSRGVAVEESGGRLRVPNGALASMIRDASGQRRLQSAHRQIALWLRSRNTGDLTQLAWHEEHATPPGKNEELCSWHVEAGHQLMNVYNIDRSKWHYERARERTSAEDLDVDAVEGLADIDLLTGRTENAIQGYLDAMERAGSTERSLQIASKAVYGFYRRGSTKLALRLGAAALRQAGEPVPRAGFSAVLLASWTVLTFWRRPTLGAAERDALCQLYPVLAAVVSNTTPSLLMLYVSRGAKHARGLTTPNASTALMFAAQGLAVVGTLFPFVRSFERRIIDRAAQLATTHDDPWAIGVVHHMRGLIEFNDGEWQAGQTSMDLAVSSFAASGDMTVGVLSLLSRAMHSYNRDHAERILVGLRRCEVAAVRQRAQDAICMAGALRAVLLARRGEPSAEALTDSLLARLDAIEDHSLSVSLAYGYLSRALLYLGRANDALARANQGVVGVGRFPNMSFMMEPLMSRLEILLSRSASRPSEWWAVRRELFLVWISVRRSPGQLANWRILAGRADLMRGRPVEARKRFESVIETRSVHRESHSMMQAHLHLASLTEATDPANAKAHHDASQNYANQLGLTLPQWGAPEDLGTITPIPSATPMALPENLSTTVAVTAIAGPLLPALQETLPSAVTFMPYIDEALEYRGNADRFQLLVVNLVFAGRDLLPGIGELTLSVGPAKLSKQEAAPINRAAAGDHILIEVAVQGLNGPLQTIGGWNVCEEIAHALGGFLHSEQTDESARLMAYLPADEPLSYSQQGQIAAFNQDDDLKVVLIVHSDDRTRATVAASVAQLGLPARELTDPDQITPSLGRHALAAFVEKAHAPVVERRILQPVVQLVARGTPVDIDTRVLRVPFVFGDLAEIIEELGLMRADE